MTGAGGRAAADGRLGLVGCGAQARYLFEIAAALGRRYAVTVIDPLGQGPTTLYGHPVRREGDLAAVMRLFREAGVGEAHVAMADNRLKLQWLRGLARAGFALPPWIHPRAVVASTARVGAASLVNPGAVVGPEARIGEGCIIHSNVNVDHDCVLEDGVNLAPGVSLAGRVHIETCATVYTGATVIPNVRIGAGAVVGAQACVLADVPPGETWVGVPAHPAARRGPRAPC